MKSKLTILQKIYIHLLYRGDTTHLTAFEQYHCQCLTKRMSEMKSIGVHLRKTTRHKITVYYMSEDDRNYNFSKFSTADIVAPRHNKPQLPPKTLLEVVQQINPSITPYSEGCPAAEWFAPAFKDYIQPTEDEDTQYCISHTCKQCWSRQAQPCE